MAAQPSVLERIELSLQAADASPQAPTTFGLLEVPPPASRKRAGTSTLAFKARKVSDRSTIDARNRALGLAGETATVERERQWLTANGRVDLADAVRHVAAVEGDGAGFDVASFALDGTERYIEVKTTCGGADTDFFLTANEMAFSSAHADAYELHRIFDFSQNTATGQFYVLRGALTAEPRLNMAPTQYRASVRAAAADQLPAGAAGRGEGQ